MSDLHRSATIADVQVDRLVAGLDRVGGANSTFEAAAFEQLIPLVRRARARDASPVWRLIERVGALGRRPLVQPIESRLDRTRMVAAVAIVALLLAIVALVAFGHLLERPIPPVLYTTEAGLFVSGQDGGPPHQLAAFGPDDNVLWDASPDGSGIALSTLIKGSAAPGWWRIEVLSATGADRRVLAEGPVDPYSLRWAPNGDYLAYVDSVEPDDEGLVSTNLYVARIADGHVSRIPGTWSNLMTWAPDGKRLTGVVVDACPSAIPALAHHRGSVGIVTAATAVIESTFRGDFAVESRPVWSPDGRQLAFMTGPDCSGRSSLALPGYAHSLGVLDIASAAVISLQTTGREGGLVWTNDGEWLLYTTLCRDTPEGPLEVTCAVRRHPPTDANESVEEFGPAMDGAYIPPIVSPDGRWVLTFRPCYEPCQGGVDLPAQPGLLIQPTTGGPARTLATANGYPVPIWTADSNWILFTQTNEAFETALWAIRPDGSGARIVIERVTDEARFNIGSER